MAGATFFATLATLLILDFVISVDGFTNIRQDLATFNETEIERARNAMNYLQNDKSLGGWYGLVSAHGFPENCTDKNNQPVQCCVHGAVLFLHYHRCYCMYAEEALSKYGFRGLPYFNFAAQMNELPELVNKVPWPGHLATNPWHHTLYMNSSGVFETSRFNDPRLFAAPDSQGITPLFRKLITALAMTNFCNFVSQIEGLHNEVHTYIGGLTPFSMGYIPWAAHDPIFAPLHCFIDKCFWFWQKLQVLRNIPKGTETYYGCSIPNYNISIEPFGRPAMPYMRVRTHASPNSMHNTDDLDYTYADETMNGYTPSDMLQVINGSNMPAKKFASSSAEPSAVPTVHTIKVCTQDLVTCQSAGSFNVPALTMTTPRTGENFLHDVTDAASSAIFQGQSNLVTVEEIRNFGADPQSAPTKVITNSMVGFPG